jgi:ADP-ribosylglycohydrolase
MSGWTNTYLLLDAELVQRTDEGCIIPAPLRQAISELHRDHDAWNAERINPLYDALMALPHDDALAAREPNDLAAIRAQRPEGPRDLGWRPSEAAALDRFHGAWTGRCVGCALGKPVEGMGMRNDAGKLVGRRDIKKYLSVRGDWPLNQYFSTREVPNGDSIGCEASTREKIAYMEPDDDVHYSLVGLGVIEAYGPTFTWDNVARFWADRIPYNHICTAETQAILNYFTRTARTTIGAATPTWTRRHRNPYREWIGAQIRADGWAWVCAGKPELAAEFAWRDAHWTHERNGIYGEMFLAAMQAAAFVVDDPWKLIEIGLSEIPRECRLAIGVRELCGWMRECRDWEACMDRVDARYAQMSPVHTINNALICVMALVYGAMDPHRSTCISVSAALDTDCNGASVGSIVGAAAGRGRFTSPLVAPLHDTIKPAIVGFTEITMTELARRTWVQWQRVDAWRNGTAPVAAKAAAG